MTQKVTVPRYATALFGFPIPDPLNSFEELQRARHSDLPELSTEAIQRERYRARHRLNYEDDPHPWIAERIAAIDLELQSRRSSAPPPAPLSKPVPERPQSRLDHRPSAVRGGARR